MKLLKTLHHTAIGEGISYLAFAFTMPLKYIWDIKLPNFIVGLAHGILFMAFCVLVVLAARAFKWELKKILVLFVSSLVPFGTFWSARKYLRDNDPGSIQ